MKSVCVVGAGPAGLVATKTLALAGLDVSCFELSSEIGGHWKLDNPSGRSAAYHSLETNTTKAMSRLSDYEMPEEWEEFSPYDRVHEWFESYIDHFGFRDRIHLGVEVLEATAREPSGWSVELRDANGETTTREFDALVACSGSYWSPKIPELVGDVEGEAFHAQQYRGPEEPVSTRDRRVVVVGNGNTGCEIACEMAAAGAQSVELSARSGTWIMPKRIDGRPAAASAPMMSPFDEVPALLRFLPRRWREDLFAWLGTKMMKRMMGDRMKRLVELGMPEPPANPLDKRATVCDPLLDSLESGAVVARPGIERVEGKEIIYTDGSRSNADVLIFATGYHLRYPYLDEEWVDTRDDDLSLFLGTMHPERHDLFIVGVSRPTGAFWPIAEMHAQFAAALLSGRYALPGAREIEKHTQPILGRRAFNPALYGLAMREELERGARRADRAAR